jgi:cytochrome c5
MKPATGILVLLASALLLVACSRNETTSEQQKAAPAAPTPQAREMAAGPEKTGLPEGRLVYQDACASCHETGIQGAPITGNSDAWAALLIKGREILVKNTLLGVGTMPPRGGVPGLSDAEIEAAVDYMIQRVH